jgi:very-short-patch-repair endonuclease
VRLFSAAKDARLSTALCAGEYRTDVHALTIAGMSNLVVASEAIAAGTLTRRDLARHYTKVYRNVYRPTGSELTAADRAVAAWLSSGREAVMCGLSAAALLGSRWIPVDAPAEILGRHHRVDAGIKVHAADVRSDELVRRRGIQCTGVERTVFDLGRRVPYPYNIIRVDALLNATGSGANDVKAIIERYPGARNIRRLRAVLEYADGGAESPQETRVRLIVLAAGFPIPETQIWVGPRRVDLGWPEWMVGIEYDGAQHWTDPNQYGDDIVRLEFLREQGWTIIRVVAAHLRDPERLNRRVLTALRAAGWRGELAPRDLAREMGFALPRRGR